MWFSAVSESLFKTEKYSKAFLETKVLFISNKRRHNRIIILLQFLHENRYFHVCCIYLRILFSSKINTNIWTNAKLFILQLHLMKGLPWRKNYFRLISLFISIICHKVKFLFQNDSHKIFFHQFVTNHSVFLQPSFVHHKICKLHIAS